MLSVDFFCAKPTADNEKPELRTEIARLETQPGRMQQVPMPFCRPEDGGRSTNRWEKRGLPGRDTEKGCESAGHGIVTVFFAATMVAPRGGLTASKRLCAAVAAPSGG